MRATVPISFRRERHRGCNLEQAQRSSAYSKRGHASIMKTNVLGMSKLWSCAVVLLACVFVALVVKARVSIDPFVELAYDHKAGSFLAFDISKGERIFFA